MKLPQFDFQYPLELVAQVPSAERGQARLLIAHRKTEELHHTTFDHILDFLENGDCLVVNDTKVFKARLLGTKENGAKVEIFILKQIKGSLWECLSRSRAGLEVGQKIFFDPMKIGATVTIKEVLEGFIHVEFQSQEDFEKILNDHGHMPLPPYIERPDEVLDSDRYQTIFASNRFNWGAVAAPTAGLHWTPELLEKARAKGIEIASITLHVGIGTFLPIRAENILEHKMHAEYFELSKETAEKINNAKRVVAVGTTTVRVLESSAQEGKVKPGSGWTELFITPGFQFQIVNALQTNFHQPKSSLLVMVSAFAGHDFIFRCYDEAISYRYQLFSYGDTMLIL
ncbi:MAG: tRNA preQ1(34) S-adenosylmethionine ribosyltransferase-isomerase QueA [Deltaproteobacteria bacterium]|nr:tRNA preQ1(34) S-adenosylmethionine ribosyltransferase-isomerase QueA [Deltaproteobacteria bacterium]